MLRRAAVILSIRSIRKLTYNPIQPFPQSNCQLGYPHFPIHCTMSTTRSNEERLASQTTETETTVFDKILNGEIPCEKVYEDEKVLAFNDINPTAPIHVVLIPKVKNGLSRLIYASEKHQDILGHLMIVAAKIASDLKLDDGYRLVVNDGKKGCQSVYHLHLHIIGGRQLKWPPG